MRTIVIGLIALLGIMLSSCIRDAKVTPPKSDPKLVVTCFISPEDTVLKAKITLSKPVLGVQDYSGYDDAVSDAQINISDGVQTLALTFNPSERAYVYDLKEMPGFIKVGGKYYLTASMPGGKYVKAETTVPTNTVDSATANIAFRNKVENSFTQRIVQVSFLDIAGQENRYRIEAYIRTSPFGENRVIPLYFNSEEAQFSYNILSDQERDGKLLKSGDATYYYYQSDETHTRVFAKIYNTSKEYYDYHRSINNFQGDSPFAEPVLVYTNIENGLGVFASYTSTVISTPVPAENSMLSIQQNK